MATENIVIKLFVKGGEKAKAAFQKLRGSALAVTAALAGIVIVGRDMLRAFTMQTEASAKLEAAAKNVEGAVDGANKRLEEQATALQKLTGFADEQIINSQALLSTFQLNEEAVKALTPRILDMAQANAEAGDTNIDLRANALAVGKAFTSGIGALTRYGVALSKEEIAAFQAADQTGKLAILTKVLDANFKGQAEAVANSEGNLRKLTAAIDDQKEKIGKLISDGISPMRDSLLEVLTAYEDVGAATEGSNTELAAFGETIGFIGKLFVVAIDFMALAWREFTNGVKIGTLSFLGLFSDGFDEAKEKLIVDAEEMLLAWNERMVAMGFATEAMQDLVRSSSEKTKNKVKGNAADMAKTQIKAAKEVAKTQEALEKQKVQNAQSSLSFISSSLDSSSKKQKGIWKAASIAQATANTANAVTKALTLGPILGPIAAVAVGAAGAAQIGKIASLQDGGIIPGTPAGQLVRAGENSQREAIIPLEGGAAGIGNTIVVEGNVIVPNADEFVQMVDSGLQELAQRGASTFADQIQGGQG